MKKISKTLLVVLLIPLMAYAGGLPSKKKNKMDHFFEKRCAPTNVILYTDRDDVVVGCGANVNINAGEGRDIIAFCSDGVDAIKITKGGVYVDRSTESTEDYDVEGTNDDDIIVLCREGITVNSLDGNDTIVECPDENTVLIF